MNAEMQRVHKKPVHQTPEVVWAKIVEYEDDIRKLCHMIHKRFHGVTVDNVSRTDTKVSIEDMMQAARLSLFTTLSRMTPERFASLNRTWFATAVCNQARTTFFRDTGEHRRVMVDKDGKRQPQFVKCVYNMRALSPSGEPISLDEAMSGAKVYRKF